MTCKNCGAELPEGAKFCTVCGAKLEEAAEAVAEEVKAEAEEVKAEAEETKTKTEEFKEGAEKFAEDVKEDAKRVAGDVKEDAKKVAGEVKDEAKKIAGDVKASLDSAQVGPGGKVGFVDAIKLFFKNYVNFTGRATKSEFWWAFLFQFIVSFIACFIPIVGTLISLALLIPGISVSVRRLHDIGKPWPWILMGLIPIAGCIILIVYFVKDSDGDNQWGPAAK